MRYAALLVALISLRMAWPGLHRREGTAPASYALRWVLFGMLGGSTLLLVFLLLGLLTR